MATSTPLAPNELRELALTFVPGVDLVAAAQVSQNFEDCVFGSPALRRTAFVAPPAALDGNVIVLCPWLIPGQPLNLSSGRHVQTARLRMPPKVANIFTKAHVAYPSPTQARVWLKYYHSKDATMTISAERLVVQTTGVTMGALFESAFKSIGDVFIAEPVEPTKKAGTEFDSVKRANWVHTKEKTSLKAEADRLTEKHGERFILDVEGVIITLYDVVSMS